MGHRSGVRLTLLYHQWESEQLFPTTHKLLGQICLCVDTVIQKLKNKFMLRKRVGLVCVDFFLLF